MAYQSVAQTILAQLGGNAFCVMTGAKTLTAYADGLSFRIPGSGFAQDGINYVRVTLTPRDTYDVEFSRVRGRNVKILHTALDIYNDQLRAVFSRATGLATSLTRG